MKLPNFDIQTVIDFLQGSTETIDSAIEILYPGMDREDLDQKDLETIDDQIFVCETCGWWCEISERADDEEICEDCAEADG